MFIDEFVKRLRQDYGGEKVGLVRDQSAFSDLPPLVKQEVNDVLYAHGIKY